jgi:hypothetical protein
MSDESNPILDTQLAIRRYIALPLAITVIKQDKEKFEEFKLGNIYLDLLDSIIEEMHRDYLEIKALMYSKYHIDIKKIDNKTYKANNEVYEFTPEELKEMSSQIMSEYLNGEKAKKFERKERI